MRGFYNEAHPLFHNADMLNNLLTGKIMGVSSPSDATINCTFLSGFTGSTHCTVQYGTDPTYMNLPYSAESTETGTAGDSVSVVLRERLNSSTVYYYTVSAVSGDITVTVVGTFTTPQYSKSRGHDDVEVRVCNFYSCCGEGRMVPVRYRLNAIWWVDLLGKSEEVCNELCKWIANCKWNIYTPSSVQRFPCVQQTLILYVRLC